MYPAVFERNLTPNSVELVSPSSAFCGVAEDGQIVQGHARVEAVIVTVAPPDAWFHVVPPSVETSTPATVPPPASDAVPLMMTTVPAAIEAPAAGLEIVDVGAVVSAEALAAAERLGTPNVPSPAEKHEPASNH